MPGFWKPFTWLPLFQSFLKTHSVFWRIKGSENSSVNISVYFVEKNFPNILDYRCFFLHILGCTVLDNSLGLCFQFSLQNLQMKINF